MAEQILTILEAHAGRAQWPTERVLQSVEPNLPEARVKAFNSPRRALDGVPFAMYFFLATVIVLAAIGDLRVMRAGVRSRSARLARHLWRMCFALFIAAGSFFSIGERVATILPEPFTSAPARMLPIVLVFGAMFYWLWRVRGAGAPDASGTSDAPPFPR